MGALVVAITLAAPGCEVNALVAVEPGDAGAALDQGAAPDEGAAPASTTNAARMGINSGNPGAFGPDVTRYFDNLKATGATWFAADFSPADIAPTNGTLDFSGTDEVMAQAQRVGVRVIATLAYNPPWLGPYHGDPSDHAAWAKLAAQIVARYPQLAAVQIWHEPNLPEFWGPSPDVAAYTDLLKQGYAAIKAVAPAIVVLAGATAPAVGNGGGGPYAPEVFFQGIYDNGGKGSFDHAAHHPASYPDAPDPTAGGFGATQKIRDIMVAHGDAAKQIWATFAGAPTLGPSGVTESAQAQHVTDYLTLWWYGAWTYTGPFLWYNLWDNVTPPTADTSYGLYRHDWSPRPARDAFAAFAQRSQ